MSVSASVCARRSSSWLTSLTTSRATTRSSSRTTADATIATTARTTALIATFAQEMPVRSCRTARSTNASVAVAEMTEARSESAERPTSSAKAPTIQPALKAWLSAQGAMLQSRRKMKTTSNIGEETVRCSRHPPTRRQRSSRKPLSVYAISGQSSARDSPSPASENPIATRQKAESAIARMRESEPMARVRRAANARLLESVSSFPRVASSLSIPR